jgi:hypothetical protein
MIIEILNIAEKDLIDGYWFYEDQSKGLGDYFLDSIFSDIESLQLYAGIQTLQTDTNEKIFFPRETVAGEIQVYPSGKIDAEGAQIPVVVQTHSPLAMP